MRERRMLDGQSLLLGVLAFVLIAGYLLARRHWAPGARKDPGRAPVTAPSEVPASTPGPGTETPFGKREPRRPRAR